MSEDDIDIKRNMKELDKPAERKSLPAPPQPILSVQSELAITPIQPKDNVEAEIIPFEPIFDDDYIYYADLLSAICGV